ncbi:MAG: hypothetical protein ACJ72E_07225 [Marmoricola sp.]
MYSLLAKSMTVVALATTLTACGSGDTVDDLAAFCNAKVTFEKVQQTGKVGEFGPALKAYTDKLPDNASPQVSGTAKQMAKSWDAIYSKYEDQGGDPNAALLVDGTPPPEIAGMRAEWTQELSRTKVRAVYAFADKECTRDGVS